jgi:hypothetical protein
MGRIIRNGFKGVNHDRFNQVIGDRALRARPISIDQPVKPVLNKAVPPLRRSVRMTANLYSNVVVVSPSSAPSTILDRIANDCAEL